MAETKSTAKLVVTSETGPRVASPEDIERAWDDPRLANVLYHDWEASKYDAKWSISYDERCVAYARDRFAHIAGKQGWPYAKALEIGCGTGFFLLNLRQAGVLSDGAVTDISPGMVEVATRNARGLGFDVDGRVADAESVPYPDDHFDLVIGHAVLHRIPDVEKALREALRVLKPGGRFVFCGEPTKRGDVVARKLSQLTWGTASRISHWPLVRKKFARTKVELEASSRAAALEGAVEVHRFDPRELRGIAMRAGAIDVETVTEELTASWFGWPVRTVEAAVKPGALGWPWSTFAHRGWDGLSALDEKVLSRVVPDSLFYNVCLTGTKP